MIRGIKTLELRMLHKCVNTAALARFLDSHSAIRVNCNHLEHHLNYGVHRRTLEHDLPAPLFTIDIEKAGLSEQAFIGEWLRMPPPPGRKGQPKAGAG